MVMLISAGGLANKVRSFSPLFASSREVSLVFDATHCTSVSDSGKHAYAVIFRLNCVTCKPYTLLYANRLSSLYSSMYSSTSVEDVT